MKAKLHSRERERLDALRSFGVLDTGPDALFDELVALAAELLEMPIALVSLVDEHRQWFKARTGFEPRETSREESFCAHAILGDGLLVVEDTHADPRFADNPLVSSGKAGERIRFYAGALLLTEEKLPLGTLCVLDHRPRRFGARERRRLGLLRDQVMALLERRRLQLASERLTRRKSAFLARVSHEVRTPLAAILGYAELLGGSLDRADDLEMVRTILRNGRHLQSIIDDLLDHSRIEAGRLELNLLPCALDELLSDIDTLMSVSAREKGIEWRIDCPDALPVEVLTDTQRLRQILVNLVGNALKFVERGSVVLSLTARADSATLTVLEFAVRDTGIGMSVEQIGRVFAPYGQAESDTAARFGGSGLGLSISQEFTRLLGGELLVESQPGVGSVFRLRLPCEPLGRERRVPVLVPAAGGREALPHAAPGGAITARRVLVVDDQDDVRVLIGRTLAREGFDVVTVDSGTRALEALGRGARGGAAAFDAVVLDMQMPGLDGFDVLAEMASEGLDIPTIVLTADALTGQRERCVAAGCRAYLTKPFTAAELVAAVTAQLTEDPPSVPRERADAGLPTPSPAASERGPLVLIVDDGEDLARALARLLSRHGYRTATALTGDAALALADREPPDCILLDRELPDMNAAELIAKLRERESLVRTRFVSLTGSETSAAERRRLGFDRYLRKPVALPVLLDALGELLEETSPP